MIDTLGRGFLESLRKRVSQEIRAHQLDNQVVRRTRYPIGVTWLRALLAEHPFLWFLAVYLGAAIGLAIAEIVVPETLLPPWTGDDIKGLLKDTAGFLITAQVGILGVVSVAVGLVTLIAQRDDRSSTSTDIRLYYSQALAYDIIASSAALLVVLSVQVFWPAQFGIHQLGFGSKNLFFKALLTAIHICWLSTNIAGFAQFLATTLRFVEPRAREEMREQYTSNIVLPDDLRTRFFRQLCLLAPKSLISISGEDHGPEFTIGYNWSDTGKTEIQRTFRRPRRLKDIRIWPLRLALGNWWRRTVKRRNANKGSTISLATMELAPSVTFPLSFEGTYEGVTIVCRRDGGANFQFWELWLIRWSFRFTAARKPRSPAAPSPSAFLEELADKVIGQIERLAVTGFRAALDEMVRYHIFLVNAYNSRDESGLPVSLAQFGGIWETPLQGWIHHYRRVFERAAEKLDAEPSFIETLAHVPYRLLNGEPEEVSEPVETTILDLGLHLVVMLENWVTRRTSVDTLPGQAAQPRLALAGSDRRSYDRVLLSFTGAWERLLKFGDTRRSKNSRTVEPSDVLWNARRARWPFLERHLWDSAYFLALAVWNEDEAGAERFRDIMLRWTDAAQGALQPDYLIRSPVLLSPRLFRFDWPEVETRLTPLMRNPSARQVDPNALFTSLLHYAFNDLVSISAAVMLAWYINEQQASDIGGRAAQLLIGRAVIPGEGSRRMVTAPRQQSVFEGLLWTVLRADLGDEGLEGTYGASIDRFVGFIDRMSERRVVPGRIYSSWSRDGLATLTVPFLALLLAHLPEEADDIVIRKFAALTASEQCFGDADSSLRRISSTLDGFNKALCEHTNLPLLDRGARKFSPNVDLGAAVGRLTIIISGMRSALEDQRLQRLVSRPIDPDKIEKFRKAMDEAMKTLKSHILPFVNFEMLRGPPSGNEQQQWSCLGIDRAQLTNPAMDWEQSDLPSTIAGWFQEHLEQRVWVSFSKRPRQFIGVLSTDYPNGFWEQVRQCADTLDRTVILIVPFGSIGTDLTDWMYRGLDQRPDGLIIEYLEGRGNGGGISYEATVNSIDVYSTNMPDSRAVLFSAEDLRSIKHAGQSENRLTSVTYEDGDSPHNGTISVRFDQQAEWRTSSIYEFVIGELYGPATRPPNDPAALA